MDENLGTLKWDFRAQLAKFYQDCDAADARVNALRQKWSQPFSIGGPGGGAGGTGSGLSPATQAAVQAASGATVSGGGMGPNFTGTSNGDVTWNLRQAVRDTGARYGGGGSGRGRMGGAVEEDWMAERGRGIANDYLGESRIRMALSDAREQSRRQSVLESQQAKYDELKEQHDNSFRGKLNNYFSGRNGIQGLIRSTVIGFVADAAAGIASASVQYQQSITLSGNDAIAQSRATNALQKSLVSSAPVVGGILGNVYNAAGGTAIETQNILTERQTEFQDIMARRGTNARVADLQRSAIAAGPNALTASIRSIQAQRTALAADLQVENKKTIDAFNTANPVPTRALIFGNDDPFLEDRADEDYQRRVKERQEQYNKMLSNLTAQNNRLMGPLDQSLEEKQRAADYNLGESRAGLNRLILQNQFRPVAGEGAYLSGSAENIYNYYQNNRDKMSPTDIAMSRTQVATLGQQAMLNQRDAMDNLRFGSAVQYNPFIESTMSFTDRSVESQGDKLDEVNATLSKIVEFLLKFPATSMPQGN